MTEQRVIDLINEVVCGDCFRNECESECEYFLAKQALRERNERGNWIPCSERLPTPHHYGQQREMYLVTLQTGCVSTRFYEFNPNGYLGEGWADKILTVLAWQPLPEPYQEKARE